MKYIVTGAAGLIGSAVVRGLNLRNETDILTVDHIGISEKWKNLSPLFFMDYMEKDTFFSRLKEGAISSDIAAVIHLGACSSTTESDGTYLIHNNFEYTKELAEFCTKNNIRFLYASSAATYGDGSQGYSDDEERIEQLRPLNGYGFSKQIFDLWAKHNGMLNRIAGMKFTNVFGPNERHKGPMRSMVCRAFEQITEKGSVSLFKSERDEYADGEQKRDFIYVKDAVDMILFLLDHPELNGIYNIGSGIADTWNLLAESVFDAMNRPINIQYIDMPATLRGKYQYYTCADMRKMRAAGYDKPITPLHDAIADYVKNYLIPDKHLGDEND